MYTAPCSYAFTDEFYRIFNEEIISVLCHLFQRTGVERIFPNSSFNASITLIPKPKKLKENYDDMIDQYLS